MSAAPATLAARLLLGGALLAAVAGCGSNVCEDAAEICADQREVAAPDEKSGGTECEGAIEAHATCIAEAESCAPDVVAACWEEASGESEGQGGGA